MEALNIKCPYGLEKLLLSGHRDNEADIRVTHPNGDCLDVVIDENKAIEIVNWLKEYFKLTL